ncbi:MAG: Trk system potassium transporter TrkA [Deltaproteobacteria bacterium]|nr:Trk system potassium transporter TrkA [Deltaproteobacteria bacterium]
MSIIIIGAGEVGYNVAWKLSHERKDIVVIDKDEERIERVSETLDVQAIHGSGSSMKVLRNAGIEEAEIVIAATNSDEVNMVSCLVAGVQASVPTKIARIRDPEYASNMQILGSDRLDIDLVINTDQEMVASILRILETPGATDVVDFAEGKIRMASFLVGEQSPIIGKQLMDLSKLYPDIRVIIAAIYRDNQVIIPRGKDKILERDLVFLMGESPTISALISTAKSKHISPLRRVMIFGGGDVGLNLAKALEGMEISTKIIEPNEERCQFLAEELDKTMVLKGNFTSQDLLEEENVREMDAFVAVTPEEEKNILISLLAKRMGARRVVASINRIAYSPLAYQIGVDVVISPCLIAVNKILQYIRRGKIVNVATLPDDQAEVIEIEALETSDLINKPLKNLRLPKGVLVGSILRGGRLLIPYGETVILPGDKVAMVVATYALQQLEKLVMVKLEYW